MIKNQHELLHLFEWLCYMLLSSVRAVDLTWFYCFRVGFIVLIVGLIVPIYEFIVLFVDSIVCNEMGYCL